MTDRQLPHSCPYEDDVLALVSIGQWPARAEPALVAHASACDVCRELAMAAGAVIEWRDVADAEPVRVPDASLVWYRAQMQARRDAAARATRPMLVAQLVAAAVVTVALLAWIGSGATGLAAWWHWLRDLMPATPALDTSAPLVPGPAVIAGLVGLALVVVGAVGFYLADINDAPRPTRSSRGG